MYSPPILVLTVCAFTFFTCPGCLRVLIPPQVTGLDATAARSCFLMLRSLLSAHGVRLVFAAMAPKVRPVWHSLQPDLCPPPDVGLYVAAVVVGPGAQVRDLLLAHGVVGEDDTAFDTLDAALEHCEEVSTL